MRGTTLARSKVKPAVVTKTSKGKAEDRRQKQVKKVSKEFDHLSSTMNTCQAVFKADGSKASTNKSAGVKKALKTLLNDIGEDSSELILENFKSFPLTVQQKTTKVVIEFAGTKFKMMSSSGDQYINYINRGVLNQVLLKLPNVNHIVICEEKYSYTPDDLKANTRAKRQKKEKISITHLKEEHEIISSTKLSKRAVTMTATGKSLISSYLAKNTDLLEIKSKLTLDIDSEAITCTCSCDNKDQCTCSPFCTPIRLQFEEGGLLEKTYLDEIEQRKGEAEMSMIDWIPSLKSELNENECIVSLVTSADIDTVVIHLFAVSLHWDRDDKGEFKWPIYVWLQKKTRIVQYHENDHCNRKTLQNRSSICCCCFDTVHGWK